MFYEHKQDYFALFCERMPLQYPLHVHQYIEYVHVIQGSVTMQIGSEIYTLNPGDLAIIFPNVLHDYHTLSGIGATQLHILNCYLNYLPFHKEQLLNTVPQNPVLHKEDVHEDIFYSEKRLFEISQENYASPLVSSLVSLILCRIFPKLHLVDYSSLPPQSLSSDIVAYIGKHFREDISLTSVAKNFGIGKYALSRIFSNVLQINFASYINYLRMDYADYMLLSTNLGMIEIAIECGYHNLQTFYRLFKQFHGCTPKEYREKMHSENSVLTPRPYDFVYESEYGLQDL